MTDNSVFGKTRRKLIYNIMLVVEVFMIVMSIFIYSYFKGSIYETMDRALLDEFHFINNQLAENGINSPIVLQDPKDIVYIFRDNQLKYYTQNRYFNKIKPDESRFRFHGFNNDDFSGYNFRILKIKEKDNVYIIMRNIDSEKEGMSHLVVLLITADIVSLLMVYIIAKYLSKKALKPIEMTWENQVKFVQDASHELRTPVTIVQSKLEYLLKSPQSTIEDEAETVAAAMRETRQLKKMINELLSLTKEESIVKINREDVDLGKLFSEIAGSYGEIAEYQEKTLKCEVNMKNPVIHTDPNKLTQLIRILVENAFKYTNKGDTIEICSEEKPRDRVHIIVRDSGIGIDEKDQKHIFERFFRSDSVRAEGIDGSGIGLSIAKLITNTIGGNIKVKSKLGEGTSFIIEIPRGRFVRQKKNRKK